MERLSFWVEGVSCSTPELSLAIGSLDQISFIVVGYRWERQHFPTFALQHMTDQVIFMQPLHDQNDAPGALVV
jgi:hypothetical protein